MAYTATELRAVQEYFGFLRPDPIEKDWHVVRVLAALASLEAAPFTLVFGGGTALARAHKLVRRMSEDVDFKVVPGPEAPGSRSARRQQLGELHRTVAAALQAAGFAFDPADPQAARARNENRYALFQLPYAASGAGEGLRPTIQLELTYAALRRPPVQRPVASLIAEAYQRPPEVPAIACVSLAETAAEKLVALTRRVGAAAAAGDAHDPTLVRHLYDLHVIRLHYEPTEVAALAREIMVADAAAFGGFPAYRADPLGATLKAVAQLAEDPAWRADYDAFHAAMIYGTPIPFAVCLATLEELAAALQKAKAWRK